MTLKKYVLDIALKQVNEHTDITVKVEQHKTGRSITGFSFSFKQKKSVTKSAKSIGVSEDITITLTDAQRYSFASKLSELPEMGKLSQGTESYEQFAVRIADMLKQPEKLKRTYSITSKSWLSINDVN